MNLEYQNSEKKSWFINNGVQGFDMTTLPRCQAIAKSTGEPCRRPAIKGQSYCGIHSGRYKPGAKIGNQSAYTHGFYTAEIKKEREDINALLDSMKKLNSN